MNAMAHLGMKWTGAGHQADGRKILIAENLDSHHRWSIDPVTGIGEPILDSVAERSPARETQRVAPAARSATGPLAERTSATRRAGPAGPMTCEHCGAKSVYQIRFSQNEFVTKCLSCKRFVVDGRVERQGRARAAVGRGASLWLPLE